MTHDKDVKEQFEALLKDEMARDLDVKEVPKKVNRDDWAIGLAALAFAAPFWLGGARLTTDGWVIWLNAFLQWLKTDVRIPVATGSGFLIVVAVGLLYSHVEVKHRPLRISRKQRYIAPPIHWIVWSAVIATDLASTYTGLRDASTTQPFIRAIAASVNLSLVASVLITFAPEWIARAGWAILTKRRRSNAD